MANQNTSIGKYPEDPRSGANGELQTLTAVPNDFSIQISIYRTSSAIQTKEANQRGSPRTSKKPKLVVSANLTVSWPWLDDYAPSARNGGAPDVRAAS
jgi:hypothetical protein